MLTSFRKTLAVAGLLATVLGTGTAEADEMMKMRIRTTPSPDFTNLQTAVDQGIFKKHGLDVQLVSLVAGSTAPAMIMSGSLDASVIPPDTALTSREAGIPIELIYGGAVLPAPQKWGIFVAPDSGIKTAKDLEGKTFGMIVTTGAFEIFFRHWMEFNGADPDKVKVVKVPLTNLSDFIKSGRIDAGIVATPFLENVMATSGAKMIGDIGQSLKQPVMINAWGTSKAWADKHPKEIAAFRASMNEADQWLIDHPKEGHAEMIKATGLPADLVENTPYSKIKAKVEPQDIKWWYDIMTKRGLIKGDFDPDSVIYSPAK